VNLDETLHKLRETMVRRLPRADSVLAMCPDGPSDHAWFTANYGVDPGSVVAIDVATGDAATGHELDGQPAEHLDLIFGGQILSRLPPAAQARILEACATSLKPGGYLAIDGPDFATTNEIGWRHPTHGHLLTHGQITAALERAGFELVSSQGLIGREVLLPPTQVLDGFVRISSAYSVAPAPDGNAEKVAHCVGTPGESFAWWIVARRVGEPGALQPLLDEFARTNEHRALHVVHSQSGVLVERGGRTQLRTPPTSQGTYALYGPYREFAPGDYRVTFGIAIAPEGLDSLDLNLPTCQIDVSAGPEGHVLTSESLRVRDLIEPGRTSLTFSLATATVLQFRILVQGPFGLLIDPKPALQRRTGQDLTPLESVLAGADSPGALTDGDEPPRSARALVRIHPGLEITYVVDAYLEDGVSSTLRLGQIPEGHVAALLMTLIRPGCTVVDLGAHVGTMTLLSAKLGARVLAVEASPRNSRLLRAAIRYNGFHSIRLRPVAIGASEGEIELVEDGPYTHVSRPGWAGTTIRIPCVSLDKLLDAEWIDRVDVIKMDIEGQELAALHGMTGLLARQDAPAIIYEGNEATARAMLHTTADLRRFLADLGYRNYRVGLNELVPVEPDDYQAPTLVDYLAYRGDPREIPGWRVCEPLSTAEVLKETMAEIHNPGVVQRWTIAESLRTAPTAIRDHPDVRGGLARLRQDAEAPVRERAAWSATS
jgi:FkbM family methyltransferase